MIQHPLYKYTKRLADSMKKPQEAPEPLPLPPGGNEEGFVLIVAMLMLLVISLIGVFMSNSTTTEVAISGNERHSQELFYRADAGINAVIAESTDPGPGAVVTPFTGCPVPQPVGGNHFAAYDIDGVGGNDVFVYLLSYHNDLKTGLPIARIASCARDDGATAQIITGVKFGLGTGKGADIGDPHFTHP